MKCIPCRKSEKIIRNHRGRSVQMEFQMECCGSLLWIGRCEKCPFCAYGSNWKRTKKDYRELAVTAFSANCQRLSWAGTGAVMHIRSLRTGWMNSMLRACSEMLPSRFDRRAPYFRSPRMGHPILASCARIWWWRPVSRSISNR